MNLFLRVFAVSLVVILVSSCGQSGQLFIPGDPSVMATPPPASEEGSEDQTEDDSEDDPAAQ